MAKQNGWAILIANKPKKQKAGTRVGTRVMDEEVGDEDMSEEDIDEGEHDTKGAALSSMKLFAAAIKNADYKSALQEFRNLLDLAPEE